MNEHTDELAVCHHKLRNQVDSKVTVAAEVFGDFFARTELGVELGKVE